MKDQLERERKQFALMMAEIAERVSPSACLRNVAVYAD